jgi:hypothetical protein
MTEVALSISPYAPRAGRDTHGDALAFAIPAFTPAMEGLRGTHIKTVALVF